MSNYSFNYSFNISGNCNTVVNEMAEGVNTLKKNLSEATSFWDSFEGKLLGLNQFIEYFDRLGQSFENMQRPGAELNASLADLQAISNATSKELETIERFARSTAKEFGGSAAQSVESYKLLLSQLSPELTKDSAALAAMGKNIAILSKTMGGDTTAAAEVLTTAMNQYGVSLADPMAASRKMAEMMNIMAAAGREGSAELPTIKVALEQCGMAAKAAGVSFAETNAAIQVLDKAGKKGSEGGVALRNVMTTLARGRFLPKDVREELNAAGVDINKLTDNSKSLADRLIFLKPVMNDAALFSKLFGRENTNAAMALIQGIDQVKEWTEAITGTNTAVEQSQIIMESYNERLSRIQSNFDNFKISIFNVTGDFGIWMSVMMKSLTPLAQLSPLIIGVGKAMLFVRALDWGGMWKKIRNHIIATTISLNSFGMTLGLTSISFTAFKTVAVNACRAVSVAIMNIPILGWIAAAIAAIIAIIQTLWNKCKGFRVFIFTTWEVIKRIFGMIGMLFGKLWGWITGGVKEATAKLTDFFQWFVGAIQEPIAKVKAFFSSIGEWLRNVGTLIVNSMRGVLARFKELGQRIKSWISGIAQTIADKFSTVFEPLITTCQAAINKIKGFFAKAINWIRDQFNSVVGWIVEAYNKAAKVFGWEEIKAAGKARADESWGEDHPEDNPVGVGTGSSTVGGEGFVENDPIATGINGIGGSADKTDRIKNINITIDKLIDTFTIQTTNMQESTERIKGMVAEALLSAVNDVNLAL